MMMMMMMMIKRRELTEVVPDIHLSNESSHLNDGLTKEIIGLFSQRLSDFGFDVIIFIPDKHPVTAASPSVVVYSCCLR